MVYVTTVQCLRQGHADRTCVTPGSWALIVTSVNRSVTGACGVMRMLSVYALILRQYTAGSSEYNLNIVLNLIVQGYDRLEFLNR